jgi:hypothetical protein
MFKLKDVEFPSTFLSCYESVLITILKYMGLPEETLLMGTQAYFVLREASGGVWPPSNGVDEAWERVCGLGIDALPVADEIDLRDRMAARLNEGTPICSVSPRFNSVDEEWKRVHGLGIETSSVADEADLRDGLAARLDEGMPVCLCVDLYFLPHTPHYNHLHQRHYVDIFGHDGHRYYVVCPHYRFRGWVDWDVIRAGFFSPTIRRKCLIFIPQLRVETLSPARVQALVQESCQYMLGLAVPAAVADVAPQYLGLSGIRTFSDRLQKLVAGQDGDLLREALLLHISRRIKVVGYSRYWFYRLIQTCQRHLLSADPTVNLQEQFANVAQSWRAIGIRLSVGVRGNRPEMAEYAARQLERVYEQEEQLFNGLLGALPDCEGGKI